MLPESGLGPAVDLKLKNPARKAAVVRELAGTVELFMPERDPAATVVLRDFAARTGKPLADPALEKAGIRLTVLTKAEYDALAQQKKQQAAAAADRQNLGQAMAQAFEGLLGAFFQVGDHDLILQLTDPAGRFIHAEVLDGRGAAIATTSTTSADDLKVLGFARPLPADARLRIFVKTADSVVTIPFRLTDIPLP